MNGNAPDLARATAALSQLADLEAVFGPHDERLRICLAASFWLIVERFGDDDWHSATDLTPRRDRARPLRVPATADAGHS